MPTQRSEQTRFRAWAFDGCKKPAGRDHAAEPSREEFTLCGRELGWTAYPTGELFDPDANYSCAICRRAYRKTVELAS